MKVIVDEDAQSSSVSFSWFEEASFGGDEQEVEGDEEDAFLTKWGFTIWCEGAGNGVPRVIEIPEGVVIVPAVVSGGKCGWPPSLYPVKIYYNF